MKCPQCGSDMVAANTSWLCPHCGHSMPKTGEAAPGGASAATTPAVAAATVAAPVAAVLPASPLTPPPPPPPVPPVTPPVPPVSSPQLSPGAAMGGGPVFSIGGGSMRSSTRVRVPTWVAVALIIPITVVSVGVAIIFDLSSSHDRKLLKTGKLGQAVVVSSQVEVSQGTYNSSSQTTSQPTVTTNVTYRLLNVPGYSSQTYSDTLSGNQSYVIQAGQKLPVVYNPSNPSDNGLQEYLQNAASPLTSILPWMLLLVPAIVIISLIVRTRRAKQRDQAIQELQG